MFKVLPRIAVRNYKRTSSTFEKRGAVALYIEVC
jgi:hypothetical protein